MPWADPTAVSAAPLIKMAFEYSFFFSFWPARTYKDADWLEGSDSDGRKWTGKETGSRFKPGPQFMNVGDTSTQEGDKKMRRRTWKNKKQEDFNLDRMKLR